MFEKEFQFPFSFFWRFYSYHMATNPFTKWNNKIFDIRKTMQWWRAGQRFRVNLLRRSIPSNRKVYNYLINLVPPFQPATTMYWTVSTRKITFTTKTSCPLWSWPFFSTWSLRLFSNDSPALLCQYNHRLNWFQLLGMLLLYPFKLVIFIFFDFVEWYSTSMTHPSFCSNVLCVLDD